MQQTDKKCWIVVPHIPTTLLTTTMVVETYMALTNTQLGLNNTVTVTNLLNGNEILVGTAEDTSSDYSIATVVKGDRPMVLPDGHRAYTTVIVDLDCPTEVGCTNSNFQFVANGMTESEVQCIEAERACRFNLNNTEANCKNRQFLPPIIAVLEAEENDYLTSSCPGYAHFLRTIVESQPPAVAGLQIPGLDLDARIGPSSITKALKPGCRNTRRFCNVGCKRVRRRCRSSCYLFVVLGKMCQRSIFA
nr:uncharacterized protein LOC100177647 [Ciona intestinalis]|eukprot:XP_002122479.3 uncharacterized protein LOC100177647 [Ciona intestinalis]